MLEKEILGKYMIWQKLFLSPTNYSEETVIKTKGLETGMNCSSCYTCSAGIPFCTQCINTGCGACHGCGEK